MIGLQCSDPYVFECFPIIWGLKVMKDIECYEVIGNESPQLKSCFILFFIYKLIFIHVCVGLCLTYTGLYEWYMEFGKRAILINWKKWFLQASGHFNFEEN